MKRIGCILLTVILVCLCLPVAGADGFTVTYATPDKQPESRLTDTNAMTRITVNRSRKIELSMSKAGAGRTLYLEWFTLPEDAVLEQYGAGNKLLSSVSFAGTDRYAETVPVDEACVKLVLKPGAVACTVSTMFVSDREPERCWLSETPAACDMLIVAPTPASAIGTKAISAFAPSPLSSMYQP